MSVTNAAEETYKTVSDKNGNVLSVSYNGAEQVTNTYNARGKLLTRTDGVTNETETFNYSSFGNLMKYTRGNYEEQNTHRTDDKISKREIVGLNQTYSYYYNTDAAKTLSYITLPDGLNYHPLSDVNGRTTGKELKTPSGERLCGEYISYRKVGDRATNMPSCEYYGNITDNGYEIRDNVKYKYDRCGNISEITVNGALAVRYEYDGLNRLIREDNKPLRTTTVYSYDACGNIITKRGYNFTLRASEKLEELEETELKQYGYNGDKLMSFGSEKFAYDNIGNPVIYRGKPLVWAKGSRLQSFNGLTFAYNGLGRRVSKGEIEYTYDSNGNIIYQSDGLEYIYDNTGVSGVKYNGASYHYRKDVLGNIIAILDNAGSIVVKYEYDAWGNHVVLGVDGQEITDPEHIGNKNPFRYRGYYYDAETGLYYLQTRYYDPELCRFISQDSIDYADPETINGLNLYAYCSNNPVMAIDPTGTETEWWEWVLVGLASIIIIGAAIVSAVVTGGASLVAGAVAFAGVAAMTGSFVEQWVTKGWDNISIGEVGVYGVSATFYGLTTALSGGAAFFAKAFIAAYTNIALTGIESNFEASPLEYINSGLKGFAGSLIIQSVAPYLGKLFKNFIAPFITINKLPNLLRVAGGMDIMLKVGAIKLFATLLGIVQDGFINIVNDIIGGIFSR